MRKVDILFSKEGGRYFQVVKIRCLKALKPERARKDSMKVSELIEGKQEMSPEKRHLHLFPRCIFLCKSSF